MAGVELSSPERLSVMFARAGTNTGAAATCGIDTASVDEEILGLARVIKDAGASEAPSWVTVAAGPARLAGLPPNAARSVGEAATMSAAPA